MDTVNELRLHAGKRSRADASAGLMEKTGSPVMILLLLAPVAAFLLSFALGRYAISIPDLFHALYIKWFHVQGLSDSEAAIQTVVFHVRIPRILTAMLVGAALSVSGASYQGMFRNPMVSPDILGASAGAGFGAALAILLSIGIVGVQISAFLFGLVAVGLTYVISAVISRGNNAIPTLVLIGMVIATLFSSFISMTKYVADPYSKLPEITFWLLGGLSSIGTQDLQMLVIPVLLGAVPLLLLRWKLNVLSFGEEEAQAMGVDTRRLRLVVIVCATLMTSAAVSVSGMIGWVGLIIPHLARMLVGPNYKVLLPASLLLGSTYLLLVDDIARSLMQLEVPLGILTSLIGAPFFVILLLRGRRGWV